MEQSEIRASQKAELLEKVRKQDYGQYLMKAAIQKIRGFNGEEIAFEFPVTALIGPNGSGKSSVLGAAGCAYKSVKPGSFFPKSAIGDESMSEWRVEYECIDKKTSPRQTLRRISNFRQAKWVRREVLDRNVIFFGIERTVPAGEKQKYKKLASSTYVHTGDISSLNAETAAQVQHVLGKSVSDFTVADVGHGQIFFIGKNKGDKYSEFHFGAGESSIIRMISTIESAPANSLVLIEEIENGLHPVATRRMVEYLMDVAKRKSIQSIFTTHSDFALSPLPNEAIWACLDGRLRQGKLNVEALRAVAGRVDKKLAVFVEDEFAKTWVDCVLREKLGPEYDQVEVHAVAGDGNAVATHKAHAKNPAVGFKSLCIIDGDSQQLEDADAGILRLPGAQPERTVFDSIMGRLDNELAILTVSCQRPPEQQELVRKSMEELSNTNRDPHVIFNQLGIKIGFVPENIIRGAFLAIWVRSNDGFCEALAAAVRERIAEVTAA
ncbi:ATP-binding protein [Paraburkholderia aspalathi]|uniref:AAA family ATPase n=1 Tax=Paraburkholderia nemoris TaxID=2793076 RepID=A0ABN7LNT9_9BURK|nr:MULTISPECIES: ATP-binding protein [Paraburkholderia]MBK3811479.1 ATP-binding protein [Paraburkholderia aspalathi]CAE6761244.1 hypothetical protein R69776_03383 [Paraburkholderia nemoris]